MSNLLEIQDIHTFIGQYHILQGVSVEVPEGSITALLGRNLLDCHTETSRSKLRELLEHQRENVYTIEKKGRKKLIWQKPWFQDGAFAGLVEFSLPVPWEMPHFVR